MAMAELLQIAAGVLVALGAGQRVNHHGPQTPLLDRITWSLLGAAGLMACLGVPLSRLPVVIESQAEVMQHQPGLLRLHVTARKPLDRALCEFKGIEAYIIDAQGYQYEVQRVSEDAPSFGATRPPGLQDFGVWRITYPKRYTPTAALFVAAHRCAWWMPITRTRQGPFPVPPAAAVTGD